MNAEPLCDVGTSSSAQIALPRVGHLVEMEWLVAGETAIKFLDRAERAILGLISVGRDFVQPRSFL